MDREDYYKTIAPRPTLCVSTISEDGSANLAPYSFGTPLSMDPPLVGVQVGGEKDTLLNARETEDFVVAPLTSGWKEEGVRTEAELPRGESEFEAVGLTEAESEKVTAPGVEEAPVNLECRYREEVEVAGGYLLVGEVVRVAAKEGAIRGCRINLEELGTVGHVGEEEFCVVEEVTRVERS